MQLRDIAELHRFHRKPQTLGPGYGPSPHCIAALITTTTSPRAVASVARPCPCVHPARLSSASTRTVVADLGLHRPIPTSAVSVAMPSPLRRRRNGLTIIPSGRGVRVVGERFCRVVCGWRLASGVRAGVRVVAGFAAAGNVQVVDERFCRAVRDWRRACFTRALRGERRVGGRRAML
jgi:hypothetical protein